MNINPKTLNGQNVIDSYFQRPSPAPLCMALARKGYFEMEELKTAYVGGLSSRAS